MKLADSVTKHHNETLVLNVEYILVDAETVSANIYLFLLEAIFKYSFIAVDAGCKEIEETAATG